MIDPISGALLAEALGITTGIMAGMTAAQAISNSPGVLGSYDIENENHIIYKNNTGTTPAISGDTDGTIVQSTESDPIDAWDEAAEEYKVNESTGGIVSGSNATTYNYAYLDTGSGVQAVAPVAVDADYALLSISQLLGLSIDLSTLDPVFKSQALDIIMRGGMAYSSASNLLSAWWDGAKILFGKAVANDLYAFFEEYGIGTDEKKETDISELLSVIPNGLFVSEGTIARLGGYGSYYVECHNCYVVFTSDGVHIQRFLLSDSPGGYAIVVDIDRPDRQSTNYVNAAHTNSYGHTYYYDTPVMYSLIGEPYISSGYTYVSSSATLDQIAEVALYGYTTGGVYPEGTASSQATKYTPDQLTTAGDIIAGTVGALESIPVIGVNLPANHISTLDSLVDPTSDTLVGDVIGLPAPPLPLPVPNTNPSNDDLSLQNSSIVNTELVNQLVEELANTVDPQPPQSTGVTPFPLLPGLPDGQGGSTYPSIVPSDASGLIHVYNPTNSELASFGRWLWVTYADASIDKIWNNPFDGIIGAFEIYVTPEVLPNKECIRSGFLICATTANVVQQRYLEIDCGTVVIPEFYGNYLDYSPYSQAYIYLPFIGICEVSIDDIVGHAVNIRYRVDVYNGSCIAMIYVAKGDYRNLCYQFSGNCAVEIPLSGGSQAAIKAGMMQADAYARATVQSSGMTSLGSAISGLIAGAGHGGILGGIIGGLTGAIGATASYGAAKLSAGAQQEAARVANKSSVMHSGTFGSSCGAMGLKIPQIMIRNPIQVKVVNYNDDYGFPAHKRVIIGGCHGYLRVKEVNVISAHATNDEKRAIEEILKSGVYIE